MNLFEKISAVMKDVEYISKDDTVAFGNTKYKAVSEEKVTSSVREKLIQYKLVIMPVKQEHKREGTLSTVDVTYRIVNAENPEEYIDVVSSGTGADTQDKGVGKAMTYAYKYMLLRTFAIPTGEDPDKISSAELDDQQDRQQRKAVDESKLSNVDVSAIRSYLKKNGLNEKSICIAYGKENLTELTFGNMRAVLKPENLEYWKQKCGVA